MIKKERLEELIEKGAMIYVVNNKVVFEEKLNKHYTHDVLKDCVCWWSIPRKRWFFKDCFETKEDAEWYVKYGEVTKTETISFPTYEKIMQDLEGKTGTYTIIDASNVLLEVNLGKHYVDQIYLYTNEDKFNWNLSKEGYEQACEMCVHEFKK